MKQDFKTFQGQGEAIVNHRFNNVRAWIPVLLACAVIAQPGFAAGQDNSAQSGAWTPNRLADGQPDVQGFWRPENQGTYSLINPRNGQDGKPDKDGKIPKRKVKPSRIIDPADGQVPYLVPSSRNTSDNLYKQRLANVSPTKRLCQGFIEEPNTSKDTLIQNFS